MGRSLFNPATNFAVASSGFAMDALVPDSPRPDCVTELTSKGYSFVPYALSEFLG